MESIVHTYLDNGMDDLRCIITEVQAVVQFIYGLKGSSENTYKIGVHLYGGTGQYMHVRGGGASTCPAHVRRWGQDMSSTCEEVGSGHVQHM